MLYGRLPKSVNFGKLRVNFGKKRNWYSWRVQFGINCTPLVQSESSNLKRKPQKLVPGEDFSQFAQEKFVPGNLKKLLIRKIKSRTVTVRGKPKDR